MCAFWRRKTRAARKIARRVRKRRKRKKKRAKRELRAERRKEKKLKKAEKKEKAKDVPTAVDAAAAGSSAVAATTAVAASATMASKTSTPPPAKGSPAGPSPSSAPGVHARVALSPEAEEALAELTKILGDPSVDIDGLAKRLRANNGGRATPEAAEPQEYYFLSRSEIVRSAAMTSAQTALFLTEMSDEGMTTDPTSERTGP
jgi:hypothetical protein